MSSSWALLLAPGAGAGRDQPGLVAIDSALASTSALVRRMDFPYRKAGRRAPDRAEVLVRSVVDEAAAMADSGPLFLGGRSMGGRMCSMAVAQAMSVPASPRTPALRADVEVAGLMLVSYPLHPPGRPDKARTGHFPRLSVPVLFVSGTRDPFATPEELRTAARAIEGPVSYEWVEGADHGLRGTEAEVAQRALAWFEALGFS